MPSPFQLCYITDRRALERKPLLPRIIEACGAGVDLVQIREKDMAVRDLVELVKAALDGARGTCARVVVNDQVDMALGLGAHGIHLGTQSIPPAAVRAHAPKDFLVGVSCHSLEEATGAENAGADYILLGPIFETPSKLSYGPPLGLEKLKQVAARVAIPVLALGGTTVGRVKPCLDAGANGIAGISLFQNCESIEERVRELRREFAI